MKHLLVLFLLHANCVRVARPPSAAVQVGADAALVVTPNLSGQEHGIYTPVVNGTDNQTSFVMSHQPTFANLTRKRTVGVVGAPLAEVVETTQIITEKSQIANVREILICHCVVFVPLVVAWCIYFSIGRPRWLYLIVLPLTLGCCEQTNMLTNQSLVAVTDAPMGLTACQAFLMMVCAGLWIAAVDRDRIQQEGIHQYAAWLMPVTMLYTIYQLSNHIVSFKCSLSERAVLTNLCPVTVFIVERTMLPDVLKPNSSLISKVCLIGLVVGAVLYCSTTMDFRGGSTFIAYFMVLTRTGFKVIERSCLSGGKFLSTGFLAFIDGLFLMTVTTYLSLTSEGFLWELCLFLENPSSAILLLVSCMTFMGIHISGISMLRVGSATAYAVVQGLAGFIGVGLGLSFFGEDVFRDKLPAIGLAISLAAGLWYSIETYFQKMSEKTQTADPSRQAT